MSTIRFQLAVSLDGYAAGPDQSEENPLGVGGMDLHRWLVELEAWRKQQGQGGGEVNASTPVVEEAQSNVGATVMGRNMFGGGPGPWREDPAWKGWWGDDPPFHTPVFVLTHHPRRPLDMKGGTTFIFITDGIESALEQAAAGRDVVIGGGAASAEESNLHPFRRGEQRGSGEDAAQEHGNGQQAVPEVRVHPAKPFPRGESLHERNPSGSLRTGLHPQERFSCGGPLGLRPEAVPATTPSRACGSRAGPTASFPRISALRSSRGMKEAQGKDFTVVVFSGADHGPVDVPPSDPDALPTLLDWILQRVDVQGFLMMRAAYVPQNAYEAVSIHPNAVNGFRRLTWAVLGSPLVGAFRHLNS
jgi:dihydrofolate reductase